MLIVHVITMAPERSNQFYCVSQRSPHGSLRRPETLLIPSVKVQADQARPTSGGVLTVGTVLSL